MAYGHPSNRDFSGYQQEGADRYASAVASFAITSLMLVMMASVASQALVAPSHNQTLAVLDLAAFGGQKASASDARVLRHGETDAKVPALFEGSTNSPQQPNEQRLAPSPLPSEEDPKAAAPTPIQQASDGARSAASAPTVLTTQNQAVPSDAGPSEGLTGFDPRAFAGTPPLYLALQRAAGGAIPLEARHLRVGALMQALTALNDSLVARGVALHLTVVIDGAGRVAQVKRPLLFSDKDAAQAEALVGLAVADPSTTAIAIFSVELGRVA